MKNFFSHRLEILIIFFLSLTPLIWFHGDEIFLGHDSGFRLDWTAQLPNLFYSWDPKVNFGLDWSVFKGFLMIQFPEVLFSVLSGSFAIGQRCSLIFWFFVIGMGMYVFSFSLFSGIKYRFFRIFTSCFYMYNFYILSAWGIAERGKFSLYAALPVGLLLIYRVLIEKKSAWKNGVVFGFLYFFLNGGGNLPLYGATFVVFGSAFAVFTAVVFRNEGIRGLFRVLKTGIYFLLPFVLLNAYFILPNIILIRGSYSSAIAGQGGIDGLLAWEREISKYTSFFNLIRLQGIPEWYDNPSHPYAFPFLANPFFIFISFLPILTIVSGVLVFRFRNLSKQQRYLFWIFFILIPVGLLFAAGSHKPVGIWYEMAMKYVPGFAMFRSSFFKFAPSLWFPMIVLTGWYANQWIQLVSHGKNVVNKIFFSLALVSLLVYHYPYFLSDIFTFSKGYSTRVILPSYVSDMADYMRENVSSNARILVLPAFDSHFIGRPVDAYTWGFLSLDILPRNILQRRFIANDSHAYLVQLLYKSILEHDYNQFELLRKKAGITHILFREDAALTDIQKEIRTIEQVKEDMIATGISIPLYQAGLWTLYVLPGDVFPGDVFPDVEMRTSVDLIKGEASRSVELFPFAKDGLLVYAGYRDVPQNITSLIRTVSYQSECFMCNPSEFEKLVESITFPQVRIYPGTLLYVKETEKEKKVLEEAGQNYGNRIDAYLAAAQKRLAYGKQLKKHEFIDEYKYGMQQALAAYSALQGREKNIYAIRLYAYLSAHERMIDEIRDEVTENMKDEINAWKERIKKDAWISDSESGIWRMGIVLPEDGVYTVLIPSNIQSSTVRIDNQDISVDSSVRLTSGFHSIEMRTPDTAPVVFFQQDALSGQNSSIISSDFSYRQINPTRYDVAVGPISEPYAIVLQEQFNSGWQLYEKGEFPVRSIPNVLHAEANGYANVWFLQKSDKKKDYVIFYEPQKAVYAGVIISCMSLFAYTALLIFSHAKKH